MGIYGELNEGSKGYFHMDFMTTKKTFFMLMRPRQAFFICKSKNLGLCSGK